MGDEVLVNLGVEDELSEHLLRVVLRQANRNYLIGSVYGKRGNGYLRRNLAAFNNAAAGSTHLILADLDLTPCPPRLIEEWFECSIAEYRNHCHRNLIFRIAVREIEAWVIADRTAFAHFLGINCSLIPLNTEMISDPKLELLKLVRLSRYRSIKDDILPREGDRRHIGPNYNGRLSAFLRDSWQVNRARRHSASLAKLHDLLNTHHPVIRGN